MQIVRGRDSNPKWRESFIFLYFLSSKEKAKGLHQRWGEIVLFNVSRRWLASVEEEEVQEGVDKAGVNKNKNRRSVFVCVGFSSSSKVIFKTLSCVEACVH